MTRPDPLGVECPRCLAKVGRKCWASTDWMVLTHRKPHAARIRAAEQARREKEEKC